MRGRDFFALHARNQQIRGTARPVCSGGTHTGKQRNRCRMRDGNLEVVVVTFEPVADPVEKEINTQEKATRTKEKNKQNRGREITTRQCPGHSRLLFAGGTAGRDRRWRLGAAG